MKREQIAEMWAKQYPRPLAELIAVVAQPFDDVTKLAGTTIEAQKDARREVREWFARDQTPPPGGQIEAPLCEIARRLLDVLRADEAAALSAQRLRSAIDLLGDVALDRRPAATEELVVPEAARRLDDEVPFAMWR